MKKTATLRLPMPKRGLAALVTAGFSFVAADCDNRGTYEILAITAPVWVPIVLIEKAAKESNAKVAGEKHYAEIRADAEKGDPQAEYEIGNQYWGRGPEEDAAEGVRWYRRSAEQGFGDAQLGLGFAYQTGRGIEQDDVQADVWFMIAGSSQNSSAETIERARQNRDRIEASMSPAQISEAQKRARDWKPVETGHKS